MQGPTRFPEQLQDPAAAFCSHFLGHLMLCMVPVKWLLMGISTQMAAAAWAGAQTAACDPRGSGVPRRLGWRSLCSPARLCRGWCSWNISRSHSPWLGGGGGDAASPTTLSPVMLAGRAGGAGGEAGAPGEGRSSHRTWVVKNPQRRNSWLVSDASPASAFRWRGSHRSDPAHGDPLLARLMVWDSSAPQLSSLFN